MPSTFTPLGVEKMVTGEKSGQWGGITNTNWQIIEQIASGYVSTSIAGGAGDTALTITDGGTGGTAAARVIELTGTITGARGATIPLDVENWYIVKNTTVGAYTVTFKYVSGSGDTVVWSATDKGTKIIYATANDGTNPDIVDVMATSSDITLSNNNALTFNDADNSAAVGFKAPTTVSGAVTWVLPAADATTSGYALTSDSAGTLSWSAAGITTGKAIAMAMIFG
tara:strand:+ start:178 stop:855 length:678 start_codon:yes stop_codon:yes gene_type:complete